MKDKIFKVGRYRFFVFFVLAVFCVFIYKMADWQIINSDYYRNLASSGNVYLVDTECVRGEILDSKGQALAVNTQGYKLIFYRLLVDKSQEDKVLLEAVNILENFGNSWVDVLPIDLKDDSFIFRSENENQIKALKKNLELPENSSADDCIEKMILKYKIDENLSKNSVRIICSIKYGMEKSGIYYSRSTPYLISNEVSKDAAMFISEKSESLKGVKISSNLMRKYVNADIAPHIVGYTGFMSSEEYKKLKSSYSMDEKIGKTGVEGVFEEQLRGKGGREMVQVSNDGHVVDVCEKEPSVSGNTIFLTISSEVQKVANESLKRNIENARKSGAKDCTSGAVVVMNVNDFSIISAATYPSYDLSRFVEDKSYYSELVRNKTLPLLNRAFFGSYAPGSIYKPLVAIAGLQEGKIRPDERIFCSGSFDYYSGYKLRCMGVHGNTDLKSALCKSCNVYFSELGRRLGDETLKFWANKFGIGIKTGVEVGENLGIIAGKEYSEKMGKKWYESNSSQAAIGQSDNMFTPLQLATYVSTIANGGKRYRPHLVSKITDYSREKVLKEFNAELLEDTGVSEENLNAVKKGMRQVVLSGTARDFANFPVSVAAKTGTAQNSGSDHTTFICFAPYERPKIALAVVIEHGKSGMTSKNVAKDILSAYFNKEEN